MRVKKNYYHQYLVDLMVTHLTSSATGEEFFNKINAGFPGNMTAGDILITQSEIRSGVRENAQRLFRNAFSGGLGLGFSLSRVESLMEVCISGVGYVKTPEWSAGYQSLPGMDKEVFDIMGVSGGENERACR